MKNKILQPLTDINTQTSNTFCRHCNRKACLTPQDPLTSEHFKAVETQSHEVSGLFFDVLYLVMILNVHAKLLQQLI